MRRVILQSFQEGTECLTFQQLAVRNNALASLHDIANLSSQEIQDLYAEYMNATAELLCQVRPVIDIHILL